MLLFFKSTVNALKKVLGLEHVDKITPKAISIFSSIYLGLNKKPSTLASHTFHVNHSSTLPASAVGIVVFGSERYFSPAILSRLKTYAKADCSIVLVLDECISKDAKLKTLLTTIKECKHVHVLLTSRDLVYSERLRLALSASRCDHVLLFTMRDSVNQRSLIRAAERLAAQYPNAAAVFLSTRADVPDLVQTVCSNPHASGLSGILFKKVWLEERLAALDLPCDFWLATQIFASAPANSFAATAEKLHVTNPAKNMTFNDIAHFIVDTREYWSRTDQTGGSEAIKKEVGVFLGALENICSTYGMSTLHLALIVSGVTLLAERFCHWFTDDEFENLKYSLCAAINFDISCSSTTLHSIHKKIIELCIPENKNTIAILETKNIQDLNKKFVNDISKVADVIYFTKPTDYDFHFFNSLVLRTQMQKAALIILTNRLSKIVTNGKPVICLWHGLGMLKKIEKAKRSQRTMDILLVSSSEACQTSWASSFDIPQDNILPLGNVLTDHLFDMEWVCATRKTIRHSLGIDKNQKLVFFAPTFRIGFPHYYSPQLNLDHLGDALLQQHLMCVAKKHHVFSHIFKDRGIDTSGLHTSANKAFQVDTQHDFIDLLAACDVFVTDYSSSIFYAAIMNKPLVLYAPDWEEYQNGPNGFISDYPKSFPAIFVDSPDPNLLVQAMLDAQTLVGTPAYQEFKNIHVGACDGHATERVISLAQKQLELASAK